MLVNMVSSLVRLMLMFPVNTVVTSETQADLPASLMSTVTEESQKWEFIFFFMAITVHK